MTTPTIGPSGRPRLGCFAKSSRAGLVSSAVVDGTATVAARGPAGDGDSRGERAEASSPQRPRRRDVGIFDRRAAAGVRALHGAVMPLSML